MKTQAFKSMCAVFGSLIILASSKSVGASDQNSGFEIVKQVVPLDLWFGQGKAVLKTGPHNTPVIKSVKPLLNQDSLVHMEIEGSPDPGKDPAYNHDLSRQRAEALRDALSNLYGIPDGRIQVHAAGETGAATDKIPATWDSPRPIYLILYHLKFAQMPSKSF
jgi:outer membrane protein OmpA-like peptidoglycan-associated protein